MLRHHIWIVTAFQILSAIMIVIGVLVLALARNEKCSTGCSERTCLGENYHYYPCDCGNTCQAKTIVVDSVFRFGVSALVIGILGSISGSILLCIYRRRYAYEQQQTVAILQQPIYAGQPPVGYPMQNQYPYGQPLPQQNVVYGMPVNAQQYQTGQPYQIGQPYQTGQNQPQPQQQYGQPYPPVGQYPYQDQYGQNQQNDQKIPAKDYIN